MNFINNDNLQNKFFSMGKDVFVWYFIKNAIFLKLHLKNKGFDRTFYQHKSTKQYRYVIFYFQNIKEFEFEIAINYSFLNDYDFIKPRPLEKIKNEIYKVKTHAHFNIEDTEEFNIINIYKYFDEATIELIDKK